MATTGENARIFTVSELTRELKRLLEGSFRGITVRGEICEYSVRKEIVYFAIKDASSQIQVVFFRGAYVCQQLGLGIGSDVEVDGTVTLYEPQGRCQLSAYAIRPMGLGGLRLQFEQLKEKLRAQGLFDMERKKPIPPFPRIIGVITSPDGAALKDFLNVLARRHSGVHVRIIPTQVQGKGAAERIARALDYLNTYSLCDVIVVTRGGGSMEDLWPFNEEPLALAVSRSKIPVISAVGHERDYSICDFVADFRCATPSVAAEQVIEAKGRLVDAVVNAHERLRSALMYRLSEAKRRYERVSSSYFLAHPEEMVNYRRQRLDIACGRLGAVLPHRAEAARQRLMALTQRLKMVLPHLAEMRHQRYLNLAERLRRLSQAPFTRLHERLERGRKVLGVLGPESVLKRGYSILLKENGVALRAAEEASQGENLRGILANGEIRLKVER